MKINSRWVVEKGRWDNEENIFTDRTEETFERDIEMRIEASENGKILRFLGGPTGHESYYIKDLLLTDSTVKEMCICGGTINRWPACYVDKQIIFNFIKRKGVENETSRLSTL